jgi:hypothetical protein
MTEDEEERHMRKMLEYIKSRKRKTSSSPAKQIVPPSPPPNGKTSIEEMNKWELDKELVRKRIRQTEVRTMAFEMDLARIREDLVEKELVVKQLTFLLISMRQKVLAIPSTYARKLLHLNELREAHAILQEMSFVLLKELKDLPQKVTDPNWLDKLDEEPQS